jgi:hypothetical protein
LYIQAQHRGAFNLVKDGEKSFPLYLIVDKKKIVNPLDHDTSQGGKTTTFHA